VGGVLIGLTKEKPHAATSNGKKERRFLLHRRYTVYYLLIFLQGARKQLFLMFAVWLLVKGHGVHREMILTLMIINQVLALLTAPTMGRIVDRFGERSTLTVSYVALTAIMCGYAFIQQTSLLYGLYVLDSLLFVGGIALTTYLNKIAPKEDIRPTLTMGVTMNHIPSVLVPLVGGLLWEHVGATTVFLMGGAFALTSLIVTQWVRPESQGLASSLATEPAD
jgi:predicted MFS family arabinose efflux permease